MNLCKVDMYKSSHCHCCFDSLVQAATCEISLIFCSSMHCTAVISFEQAMYGAVEMETVEVCVVVENRVPESDLSVPIIVLSSSTATGR